MSLDVNVTLDKTKDGGIDLFAGVNSDTSYHEKRLEEMNTLNNGMPFEVRKISLGFAGPLVGLLTDKLLNEKVSSIYYIDDPKILKALGFDKTRAIDSTVGKPKFLKAGAKNSAGEYNIVTLQSKGKERDLWQTARSIASKTLNQTSKAQRESLESENGIGMEKFLDTLIQDQMEKYGSVDFTKLTPIFSMWMLDKNTFDSKLLDSIKNVMPDPKDGEIPEHPYIYLSHMFSQAIKDGLTFIKPLFPKFDTKYGKKTSSETIEKIISDMVLNFVYMPEDRNQKYPGLMGHIKELTEIPKSGEKTEMNLRFEKELGITLEKDALLTQPEVMEYWQSMMRIIIIGGHETTKSLMSSCIAIATGSHDMGDFDLLGKLQKEALENPDLNEKSNLIKHEYRSTLPYLNALVEEALRMYPPTGFIIRYVDTDMNVTSEAGNDYKLQQGTLILGNGLMANRVGNSWGPNPDKIDITRWLTQVEENKVIFEMKYNTFGFGIPGDERECVGAEFGRNETYTFMYFLLKNYIIENYSELVGKIVIPENHSTLASVPDNMVNKVVCTRR
jgi:hypothetical protein